MLFSYTEYIHHFGVNEYLWKTTRPTISLEEDFDHIYLDMKNLLCSVKHYIHNSTQKEELKKRDPISFKYTGDYALSDMEAYITLRTLVNDVLPGIIDFFQQLDSGI